MTVNEVRLKAAELIEERGWCQRDYERSTGQMCLIGAVRAARRSAIAGGTHIADIPFVSDVSKSMGFGDFLSQEAEHWNDDPSRTKEEVLARLREGIAS